jgi:hypothetical protein
MRKLFAAAFLALAIAAIVLAMAELRRMRMAGGQIYGSMTMLAKGTGDPLSPALWLDR